MPSRRCMGIGLLVLVAGCGGPREPSPAPPSPPLRLAVVSDPEATVVALAVAVPGAVGELPGTEGLTFLAARTLLEGARPRLDSLGAQADVRCHPAVFVFTLVATRDVWRPAVDVFLDALFRPDPAAEALERARGSLTASLSLDQASPAWQAHLALRRALYGDTLSTGWVAPACGVPEILPRFDQARIRAAAHRFAPRMIFAGAVTPHSPAALRDLLDRWIPQAPAPPYPSPRTVAAGARHVERRTITTWTALAFPFGPEADVEAIRLLGAVLEAGVAPGVGRPESFLASHDVDLHASGGALLVRVVTSPEAAPAYARDIQERVTRIARDGVPEAVYRRVARLHRGNRLMERARPEDRAAAMATALALGYPPADGWPDLHVTRERLQAAAGSLALPALATVGPRTPPP